MVPRKKIEVFIGKLLEQWFDTILGWFSESITGETCGQISENKSVGIFGEMQRQASAKIPKRNNSRDIFKGISVEIPRKNVWINYIYAHQISSNAILNNPGRNLWE